MANILKNSTLTLFFCYLSLCSQAQSPHQDDAAEIQLAMNKLKVLGSALYLAAHPDDENTRLIAYLANGTLAKTAYLSLTRGDGGQNLIGPEIREGLGVIRTQELLAARRKDGGTQFFTRANDFGYSKSPEEAFNIWDKEQVLADVVWVIRKFRPDVIITRFPGDGRGGHGHHTASALLAAEAFDIAGDPTKFPEQLKYLSPWQPKRLLTNTGRWWNPDMTADMKGVITVDVGAYNPLLGKSYTEIAAESRSQHKSQGFGSTGRRGSQEEFLEHVKGEEAKKELFEGIDITWGRLRGGKPIEDKINDLIKAFQPMAPWSSVSSLLEIKAAIESLPQKDPWKYRKIKEVESLIQSCLGLYIAIKADTYYTTPGSELGLTFELTNRSEEPIKVKRVTIPRLSMDTTVNATLENNVALGFKMKEMIPSDASYSRAYWLNAKASLGMYSVEEQEMIGKPQDDDLLPVHVFLEIDGVSLDFAMPTVYQWTDPVKGELYRPLEIIPPVTTRLTETVYIFPDAKDKSIEVIVKSGKDKVKGTLKLDLPDGWSAEPNTVDFSIDKKGGEEILSFKVSPSAGQSTGEIRAIAMSDGKEYGMSLVDISYDHIPHQILLEESKAKIVRLDIKTAGHQIGYLQGAGDAVPASLRNIGYEVQELESKDITIEYLSRLDAVVLGIRALNTRERMVFEIKTLLEYVAQGGTLIVQYNTAHRLKTKEFAPFPMTLSRDRVTDEKAPVTLLSKEHPVLQYPNKISEADFEGWVQERGLYFPNTWDERYTPILSSNDKGEEPLNGGMLVAPYGKGYYVYTGYSWFRELPAGVPGAFRLFANMVSLGQRTIEDNKASAPKASKKQKKKSRKEKMK